MVVTGVMEDMIKAMVVTGVMGDMIKAMVVTDMEAMAGTMVTVMATEETGMEADTTKATDMEVSSFQIVFLKLDFFIILM